MAIHLIKPKQRFYSNPSLIHFFSTSSSSSPPQQNENESESQQQSSDSKVSSYFSNVRNTLKKKPQIHHLPSPPPSFDLTDIRKNLNEFRKRSSVSSSLPARGDLYNQNGSRKLESLNFDNIKENLRQMRPSSPSSLSSQGSKWSNLSSFKSIKSENREGLPISVFGGEIKEEEKKKKEKEEMMMMPKTEFFRSYDAKELGEKLRMFRPEGMEKKEEGWFSLQELNQRLVKLREVEEEAFRSTRTGLQFEGLRAGIQQTKEEEAQKKLAFQKMDIWSVLNGTPKYLLEPPKEQLVETYFHPNNMSSAEKMKIELAKVREEFKMSESDCGSARVQVAQLTTKIKHLSSVLHKKDKHSRKGLIAMVQRRKKLLKYMRRTDWDSYCLSLSKLGLRDNPDYKFVT